MKFSLPMALFLHCVFLVIAIQHVSAQCSATNKTAFLRADKKMLQGSNSITISNADLRRCAELCSKNTDDKAQTSPCAAFQFGTSCILGNVNVQPFGNGVLTQSGQPATAVYQKICISSAQVCDKPFSFDWVPQTVLLGFATQVHHFASVSECLKACLESADGVPCRSAMFFFESEQCILNSDSRQTRPDLFSNDTQGLIVDYFENACIASNIPGVTEATAPTGVTSPTAPIGLHSPEPSGYTAPPPPSYVVGPPLQQPSYSDQQQYVYQPEPVPGGPPLPIYCNHYQSTEFVATENMGVQEGLERRLQNVDAGTCQRLCENNKNENGEVIGCQAFSLDPSLHTCILTSGLSMPRGSLHLVERSGVKFYEKVCLSHAQSCNGNFPFVRIPGHVLVGHAGEVRRSADLSGCLDACLYARTEIGYDCQSVMYFYSTTECIMNTETRFTRPDLFSGDTQGLFADYFDNNCLGIPATPANYEYLPASVPTIPPIYIPPPRQVSIGPPSQVSIGPPTAVSYEPPPNTYGAIPAQTPPFTYEPPPNTYGTIPAQTPPFTYEPPPPNTYSIIPAQTPPITYPPPNPTYPPTYVATEIFQPESQYTVASFVSPKGQERDEIKNGQRPDTSQSGSTGTNGKAMFSTECREDGIRVNAVLKSPTSGAIFVKNKAQTCREEFRNSENVVLTIPLAESQKDCGQSQNGPEQYSFPIVVQLNGVGVQGLMTSDDNLYNANCVFPARRPVANVANAVTNESPREGITLSAVLPPRETVDGQKKTPDAQVTLDLLRDGIPVSNLLLGEQVEIRWRVVASANIGFFVRDCSAERVGGTPPDPVPLQLIKDGCPDEAVAGRIIPSPIVKASDGLAANLTVFRFDGSRSVRLRCLIDVCAGECTATHCTINNRDWQSHGRRKRSPLRLPDPAQVPNDRVNNATIPVRKTTVSGIFTIVDSVPDAKKQDSVAGERKSSRTSANDSPRNGNATRRNQGSSPDGTIELEAEAEAEAEESKSFLLQNGQLCLVRPLFVGLMTTLAILCTAEGLVVTVCCWTRYCSPNTVSSSDTGSYSSHDWLHKRLIAAVRISSFFATAFGGEGSFSNSGTVTAQETIGMTEMGAMNRKRRSREKSQYSGNRMTTGSSGNITRPAGSNGRGKPHRKGQALSTPTTSFISVPAREKSLPKRAIHSNSLDRDSKLEVLPSPPNSAQYSLSDFRPASSTIGEWMLSPVNSTDRVAASTPNPLPGRRSIGANSVPAASTVDCPAASKFKGEIAAYMVTATKRKSEGTAFSASNFV